MEAAIIIGGLMLFAVVIGTLSDGFYYWFKYLIRHPSTRSDIDDCFCDAAKQIGPEDADINAAIRKGRLTEEQKARYAEYLKAVYGLAVDMHVARTWPGGKVLRE